MMKQREESEKEILKQKDEIKKLKGENDKK